MEKLNHKICVIYNGLPNSGVGGGSDLALYGIVKGLLYNKNEIYCIATKGKRYAQKVYKDLKKLKIKYSSLKLLEPKIENMIIRGIMQQLTNSFSDTQLTKYGKIFINRNASFLSKFDLVIIFWKRQYKTF